MSKPVWLVDSGDEHIVHHRHTNQQRDRDDLPPADLEQAARRYNHTRDFIEDALDTLADTPTADLSARLRLEIGRWWRTQPGYREHLEQMCQDDQ